MTAMTTTPADCIGEPISWLRLERFALERSDTRVAEHVAACSACRACLDQIADDMVALPPLHVPQRAPRRRWWSFALPAGLAIAAAAIVLLVIRPPDALEAGMTQVKGLGIIEIDLVRERDGIVRDDVRTFAAGDRWKVVVTCGANHTAWLDVAIVEHGANRADHPLAPARIVCGNRIPLPGAFSLTGDKVHDVCVRVATQEEPMRSLPRPGEPGVACVTVTPE